MKLIKQFDETDCSAAWLAMLASHFWKSSFFVTIKGCF